MLRKDFLGYPFDDVGGPAFIICPHTPHPLDQEALYKFVLHRPTKRLLDRDDMLVKMAAQGYTADAKEWGKDNTYLRDEMGMPIPYEYTLTASPTQMFSHALVFVFSGPDVSVENVWVNYPIKRVDNIVTPYTAFVNRNVGFWTLGRTAAQVRGGLNAMDLSDIAYNGAPYVPVGDEMRRTLNTIATGAYPTNNTVTIRGQLFGAWTLDRRMPHRLDPLFHVSGVNMVWDGVPSIPALKITGKLSADKLSVLYRVEGGPVPLRVQGGTFVELQSIMCNGVPVASSNIESAPIATTLSIGSSNTECATQLAAWLNAMTPIHQGSTVTGYDIEAATTSIVGYPDIGAFTLKVMDTVAGAYVPFDFAPYLNCY